MTGNKIFIIAGEASGDLHGSELIKEIKKINSKVKIWAVGGNKMKEAGANIVVPSRQLSVVGFTEVFSHLFPIISSFFAIRALLKKGGFNLLILIDFPEFNLLMARFAKSIGIKVFYYISPQVWAWRQGRVKKIKKYVDKMAVILPFEKDFYSKYGLKVEYVGHPLIDVVKEPKDKKKFLKKIGLKENEILISLLPGSRSSEIKTLLPLMVETAEKLKNEFTNLRFFVPIAPDLTKEMNNFIKNLVNKKRDEGLEISTFEESTYYALSSSRFAILASGTVTLEAAILNCPMIVLYKVSPLTYFLGKLLIRVKWVSLVNLIAQKQIVPELLQHEANIKRVYEEAKRYLEDDEFYNNTKKELYNIRKMLGKGGAAKKAARLALELL